MLGSWFWSCFLQLLAVLAKGDKQIRKFDEVFDLPCLGGCMKYWRCVVVGFAHR